MEALNQLAHFDQLTGLPNRVSLREDIDTILRERAGDPAHPITVAMLDLDGFKDVNDTLGHSVGDRLLQEVARRLTSVLGETRVYRLGEHEFVLVLEKCGDPLVASDVVETILKRLTAQFDLDGHQLFVDALGESAVAIETGRWILTDACKTAACWRAKGLPPIRMGVNLFPAQFRNGSLLLDVEQALSESGLPPDALELEITENIALGREEGTLAPLKALRARGVGIAFDDFGTGYASLSYLTRYPLTRIKIDRSFIQKIGEQSAAEDTAIVRSIIVMGRNLGLEVIAEGVETTAQADFLKAEGCPELQGFLFSKPLPANAFEHYLRLGIFDGPEAGLAPSRLVG